MRAAGQHLFHRDDEWRALAVRTGSALMYCQFEAYGVRDNGYGLSILKACDQFAADLKRSELQHAPLMLWGHSMGGRVAQDFVRFRPSRVLAFHIALRANPSKNEFMKEEPDSMKVPALYLMGGKDKKPKDIREHFLRARNQGFPRAWVWLPGQTHWPKGMSFESNHTTTEDWRSWAANDVVIPWTESVIRLRLPEATDAEKGPVKLRELQIENGWIGDLKTGRIAACSRYQGKQSTVSWFPNEEVAEAWARFSFPEANPSVSE
jgi:hypothetical protein